ncbi:MAG: hypothetical protein HWD61_01270 [Parachlamydiaceae bacterium]|nr:MAG: hypothetical protein HWD61_01270 [Parachlamydiaceae bacterium]
MGQTLQSNSGVRQWGLDGIFFRGRLALHALFDEPNKWKAGIIISSHTGFKKESDKAARLLIDNAWAERFENDAWEKVLKDWNSQPVFGGMDFSIPRREEFLP